jgi:outer membrane protein assembly factor BamB
MQSRRTFLAVPAAFAFVDWPQWRGPNRDGSAPSEPRKPWPERLRQVWNVPVGEGHSSPVVAGKRVFQFARQQDDEVIAALDHDSGKTLWRQSYAAPYQMNFAATSHGKGPKSTPVVAGERLYTVGISGILNCRDIATGKQIWSLDSKGSPLYGQASSPIVDGGTLIASVGPQNGGALTAFDAGTGKVKWRWSEDGPAYASPVIGEFGGVRQVVTNSESNIVGISVVDGKTIWKLPLKSPYEQNAVTPIIISDTIVYSALGNPITAIRAGSPPQRIWENREFGLYMSSPVVAAGVLWGLSNRNKGQFFGLDPKTGKTVFSSEGRQADNAALIARGSNVFALTTNSELIVFEASSTALKQVAKYSVADTPTWAHPAIVGNRVLVKDAKSLALWSAE